MTSHSFLTGLVCPSCGNRYDPHQVQTHCHTCEGPLLPEYDLDSAKDSLDRDEYAVKPKGLWRWFELLPVFDPGHIVSLGEGDTPLLQMNTIARELGIPNLYIKEEGQNPTGSFKARGISTAVSKAEELGINKIVMPSAGNAGGALAAYAARAGIKSLIYMPKNTPVANITESEITGAQVRLIDGLINDAGKLAHEIEVSEGWFNMSTFREPYRVEGKKTMGYEIAEKLGWKLPNVIIYPTGGGTGLIGMWKAFLELEQLGWLENNDKPRMVVVQSEGCAPIVKAFQSRQDKSEFWQDAHTIAAGLCVPHSFANQLILKYVYDSSGYAVSISDTEILASRTSLAQKEGIFACPEGAATLAGLIKLVNAKIIDRDESVILFNTGAGVKYIS